MAGLVARLVAMSPVVAVIRVGAVALARAWAIIIITLTIAIYVTVAVVVRPGMVASSSLRSSAWRSVDAGGEHIIWWM